MISLITGFDGFIGSWLSQRLLDAGDSVVGLTRGTIAADPRIKRYQVDITDATAVAACIAEVRPQRLFHLAAQSLIPVSFEQPALTMDVNLNGTIHLLEAVRKHSPQTVFISTGSSAEYGLASHTAKLLAEDLPLQPSSPYGVSKAAQGYMAALYHRAYAVKTIHVRPFAIIGPGKTGDALYDFCHGVLQVEAGGATQFATGNLDAERDFVDVRDLVRWLIALSETGSWGETYNLCSGQGTNLQTILQLLQKVSGLSFTTTLDPARARPADDQRIVGDAKKITGVSPAKYNLDQTVADTLTYWREH